ncbi:MAG: stage III sporulation AC/AD family protein [Oscillospiraceae bacterium]|nr:stage III sporulation AC/AD family protein [Oscillospiraceae bacterium]
MDAGIFAVIGIGVVAAVIAAVLRQSKPDYALLVSFAAGIIILYRILIGVVPVVAEIEAIMQTTGINAEYAGIMFKALGICILTQIACDVCKDAGEASIATKLEIAGRVSILVVSLPLFTRVLSIVSSLMA